MSLAPVGLPVKWNLIVSRRSLAMLSSLLERFAESLWIVSLWMERWERFGSHGIRLCAFVVIVWVVGLSTRVVEHGLHMSVVVIAVYHLLVEAWGKMMSLWDHDMVNMSTFLSVL